MKRARLLSFILFICIPFYAVSQNSDWDKVLDRYEEICGQCITLRNRIVSGEPVSDRAVTSLLQELGQLRSTLQNASGSMTDKQKKRFSAIRDSYTGNNTIEPATPNTTQPVVTRVIDTPTKNTKKETPNNYKVQLQDSLLRLFKQTPILQPLQEEESFTFPEEITLDEDIDSSFLPVDFIANGKPTPKYKDFIFETYLSAAYNRTWNFGGTIIVGNGQSRCGYGYVSVTSNLSFTHSDYKCSSNGKIEGQGVFWGDGHVADNKLFITVGTAIWNSQSGRTSVYAGAGYGINERLWRDITGKWAVVSDVSGRGIVFQTAAAFRYKNLSILPGLIYMPNSNYLLPSIGLGYSF